MENPIPYQEWPKWVKIITAISIKSSTTIESQTIKFMSGFIIAIGLYLFFSFEDNTLMYEYTPPRMDGVDMMAISTGFFAIIFGVLNWHFGSKAITWINQNSSWEERFTHRSSTNNKITYFSILTGIVLVSYLLAKLFQYFKV